MFQTTFPNCTVSETVHLDKNWHVVFPPRRSYALGAPPPRSSCPGRCTEVATGTPPAKYSARSSPTSWPRVQCCAAATTARSGGPDFAVEMFPVITVHNPPASRKPSLDESGAEECTLTIYYEASLALHEEQCPAHDNPTFPNLPSGSPLLSPIRGCTLPAPGCRGTPQLSKSIKVCFNVLMFWCFNVFNISFICRITTVNYQSLTV